MNPNLDAIERQLTADLRHLPSMPMERRPVQTDADIARPRAIAAAISKIYEDLRTKGYSEQVLERIRFRFPSDGRPRVSLAPTASRDVRKLDEQLHALERLWSLRDAQRETEGFIARDDRRARVRALEQEAARPLPLWRARRLLEAWLK